MAVLACDFGGTQIKIGVIDAGKVLSHTIEPALSNLGLAPQLPVIKAAWTRQLDQLGLKAPDCTGISVAFPSLIDVPTGRTLTHFGKYTDAPGLDLRSWARREFNLPLAIENDARMAMIGEWRHGAGRGCDNLVMITLGTGLGTGVVMEGRVLRGKHGQAGCLGGHLTVRYRGRLCHCGNVGCAEAEAGTAHLAELAKMREDYPASPLAQEAVIDYAAVFRHALAGDSCALAIRDHSLSVWSGLAVSLVHAYDAEMIILGGGIMASAEVILPVICDYIQRHALTPWGQVRVVASELGNTAALIGGEWLLTEQFPNVRIDA